VTTARNTLTRAIDALIAAQPPRAGSLVVTLFGDAISTQGGSVWLGSLIAALEPCGLNARQIRTAVFRLGQEGWLESEQRGRRSFYRYTEFGRRQYARAAERIYAPGLPPWDGHWTLLTPLALGAAARDELRRRLGWQGFGLLAGGVLAHPWPNAAALAETLRELAIEGEVVVWQASTPAGPALHALVASGWRMDEAAARYRAFERAFRPFVRLLADGAAVTPLDSFRLRTLLIHEYRRILLATTELPPALLPDAWPGHAARALTQILYRRVHAAASAWVSANMHDHDGALATPQADYYVRFGGLAPTAATATAA